MNKTTVFFKQIKWYEYLYMSLFYATIIVLSILCKSSLLIAFNAILGITTIYLHGKGTYLVNIISIIATILYCILAFQNGFYGEIIIACAFTIPFNITALVTWLKNYNNTSKTVEVNKNVSIKECMLLILIVAIISVGIYFLLEYFNSQNNIWGTISVAIAICANYFLLRRSELSFVCFIISNIICICLWFATISSQSLENLPTIVNYGFYFILNIWGYISWIVMKKKQNSKQIT